MSDLYTPLRWGILGPGSIANRFTESVLPLSDQKVMAVGSRDSVKANAFADKHGIPHRHGSYEALCADPEVDAIYDYLDARDRILVARAAAAKRR